MKAAAMMAEGKKKGLSILFLRFEDLGLDDVYRGLVLSILFLRFTATMSTGGGHEPIAVFQFSF